MPQYQMPRPRPGDLILFSTDIHNFSNPCIGWVTDERGECTVSLLAFTPTGFVQKSSVHHKDDPALLENPGWAELGCWDYAPLTALVQKLTAHADAKPAGK
jgi:hypothetical protein